MKAAKVYLKHRCLWNAFCFCPVLLSLMIYITVTIDVNLINLHAFVSSLSKSIKTMQHIVFHPLREKCPNTEFFLVSIFPHVDWIWRDTPYLSVFSPNAGKYGLGKTPNLDSFYAVRYVDIDETLYPYRGHICIKQYNLNKPAKDGFLYHSLYDSLVQYTYFTLSPNPNPT